MNEEETSMANGDIPNGDIPNGNGAISLVEIKDKNTIDNITNLENKVLAIIEVSSEQTSPVSSPIQPSRQAKDIQYNFNNKIKELSETVSDIKNENNKLKSEMKNLEERIKNCEIETESWSADDQMREEIKRIKKELKKEIEEREENKRTEREEKGRTEREEMITIINLISSNIQSVVDKGLKEVKSILGNEIINGQDNIEYENKHSNGTITIIPHVNPEREEQECVENKSYASHAENITPNDAYNMSGNFNTIKNCKYESCTSKPVPVQDSEFCAEHYGDTTCGYCTNRAKFNNDNSGMLRWHDGCGHIRTEHCRYWESYGNCNNGKKCDFFHRIM